MNKLFFIFLLFISCNNKAQEGTSIKQIQESYKTYEKTWKRWL